MADNYEAALEEVLAEASQLYSEDTGSASVNADIKKIIDNSERCKGVLTVLVTLLLYKIVHPDQDVRCHQCNLPNGFSGRVIDTRYVTPFMKRNQFPCMSESGWLTRSLEQPHPYTLDYQGKIQLIKREFLSVIDFIQSQNGNPRICLQMLFALLIRQRDNSAIDLAHPHHISIAQIISYLDRHFSLRYVGTARLPVLAIYSAYQCMMQEVQRYAGLSLLPLESHTSADSQSGRVADIDVTEPSGNVFEAIEVKHGIPITPGLVRTAYEKFKHHTIKRYYLLTTANMDSADWDALNTEIDKIARQHGCQVIINGIFSTLKYYLRLLKDTDAFISCYIANMKTDPVVKFNHKDAWNRIVAGEQ
ncbi:MAG: hypothetical protein FWG50_07395 [Kiritimatiellaeota bacterium]|nr:hypothetical protein [Kiritimatiellota bacterium]